MERQELIKAFMLDGEKITHEDWEFGEYVYLNNSDGKIYDEKDRTHYDSEIFADIVENPQYYKIYKQNKQKQSDAYLYVNSALRSWSNDGDVNESSEFIKLLIHYLTDSEEWFHKYIDDESLNKLLKVIFSRDMRFKLDSDLKVKIMKQVEPIIKLTPQKSEDVWKKDDSRKFVDGRYFMGRDEQ